MKEFGKQEFEKVAYINFDQNTRMKGIFEGDLNIDRLILALSAETGISINAENTLLIFDEIQEVPRAKDFELAIQWLEDCGLIHKVERISKPGLHAYYYSAEKSQGEIDFLVQGKSSVIPIEVKAEENLQAKSLKAFVGKYAPQFAVRTSMSDYREEAWLTNIPLYNIDRIMKYVVV